MTLSPESLFSELHDIQKVNRYIVAYSGGLDSHVLLHALSVLRDQHEDFPPLEALHVHHGVNDKADEWVKHCHSICESLSVPLSVSYINPEIDGPSLENILREARYSVFERYIGNRDVILQAHHADDQAETIMFRMLRGTGAQGASGISKTRSLGLGQLQRPLLNYSRSDLEEYARVNNLSWVEDESNTDTGFDRNFLRHEVLPPVAQRWPHYRESMLRFADINAQLQSTVDYFIRNELDKGLEGDSLNISWLVSYDKYLQIELLRGWLQRLNLAVPGYERLQQIRSEVINARQDAQPVMFWSGVELRRFNNALYAMQPLPVHDTGQQYEWTLSERLHLPSGGVLSADKITGEGGLNIRFANKLLNIRFRQGGERCCPAGRSGSHPLKKLFLEYRIPPWLRDRVPLVYDQDTLIAVADLWVCEGFQSKDLDPGFCLRWHRF